MERNIHSLIDGLQLFKALSSKFRIDILEILMSNGPMSMTAVADAMNVTGGAVTSQMKQLKDAGLVNIEKRGGKHGVSKICSANVEPFSVDIMAP